MTTNLKDLEKKAWTATFQDGVLDIIFGYYLLVMALNGVLSASGVPDPIPESITIPMLIMGGPIVWLCKRFITVPRIGLVKFGPKREKRRIWMFLGLLINFGNIGIVSIAITKRLEGWFMGYLFFTIPMCIVAYFLQFNRMYLLAVLCGSAEALERVFAFYLTAPNNWINPYLIIGGIILGMGLVYFVRFIRKYPKPSTTDLGEGVDE